jgi:hypothetical protein
MTKSKVLIPLIAVILVLLYVPNAPASMANISHKVGRGLTSFGHGVGQIMNSVGS